jgi:3-hydroxyacyl-CoA dehydrogenase
MYKIGKAAVIGAGTMGLGIAGQLANAGVEVLLLDIPAAGDHRNAISERAIQRLLDPNQPGLLRRDFAERIEIGNVEDDMHKLADCDWIAEAVVERLDIKRALYREIDEVRKGGSIVSSNTSTIPISLLVEGMPEAFQAEFAITHFFNPVRFMRLLEVVRGEHTRPEVIRCLEEFNEERMGKGIVVCNDTPGFLGNRVGVFAIQTALHLAFEMGLKAEEADAIFGRPMGIPKTGVFGLYDLIGIDLMSDAAKSFVSLLPESDAFHAVSAELPLMTRMIREGFTGNKSDKGGFYRQKSSGGTDKETLDFESGTYRDFDHAKPAIAVAAEEAEDFTLLLDDDSAHGKYAWEVLSRTLCYAAELVPDVHESLVSVDDAMKLGFNWIQGPYEMIDTMGVDNFIARLEAEGRDVPAFVRTAAGRSFYRTDRGSLEYLQADGGYRTLQRAPGVIRFSETRRTKKPILENAKSSYFEIDDRIGLIEFHSKANTQDPESMELFASAVEHAKEHMRGLIVHNDAAHFCCGANLESVLAFINAEDMDGLDEFLEHFQRTVLDMRYAPIPAVAAASGLSLGGGFEVLLGCNEVIFHANSVTGLVESLVGLVPGGGGVKEMLYRWAAREGDVAKGAWKAFTNIGYGRTAASPLEAELLCMFREGVDRYVMNRDRLLQTAIDSVNEVSDGYAPQRQGPLKMPGRRVLAEMVEWLEAARAKGQLTPHDVTTATQIAMITTGGDVDAGTEMSESEICALERRAFLELCRTAETKARIEHMLHYGTPLRN